jgi:hypothetical protein
MAAGVLENVSKMYRNGVFIVTAGRGGGRPNVNRGVENPGTVLNFMAIFSMDIFDAG